MVTDMVGSSVPKFWPIREIDAPEVVGVLVGAV
jgi:hypothetical protein